jgi:hypothetical protein
MDARALSDLIGDIYDAALDASRWHAALFLSGNNASCFFPQS